MEKCNKWDATALKQIMKSEMERVQENAKRVGNTVDEMAKMDGASQDLVVAVLGAVGLTTLFLGAVYVITNLGK